jgi:hypothetical protein
MKIVVKMVPLPAMLGVAENTWMAFAIMADATKVTPRRVGEEDVSAKIDSLDLPHKTPTGARQPGQVHRRIWLLELNPGARSAAHLDKPGQPARRQSAASSSVRRGSATEGEGAPGWLRRFLLETGLRRREVSLFIPAAHRNRQHAKGH